MIAGRLARTCLMIIACLSLASRHARADEPSAPASRCIPPESVTVQVAPFADKRVAERVAREIASVLETMPSAPCWRAHDPPRGPTIHIEVRWPDAARARVVIVATTSRRVHYGIRELDLQKLPRDGIPLAVAVAKRSHLLSYREVPRQELLKQPLICAQSTADEPWRAVAHGLVEDAPQGHEQTVSTFDMAMTLVSAGYGIAVAPAARLTCYLRRGIAARPLAGAPIIVMAYLLRPSSSLTEPQERFARRARSVS